MGNNIPQWIDDALNEVFTEYSRIEWPTLQIKQIIARHAAAHVPAPSELERQVREKWDAIVDGDCTCEEFVQCEMCASSAEFGMFALHNATRIAEALVARLPKEEK